MKSLNRVQLIGNLGRDPEELLTGNNTVWTSLAIATETYGKKDDGTYETYVKWVNVSVFGRSAEYILGYACKGSKVFIEGQIEFTGYEDDDGNYVSTVYVTARDTMILSGWKETEEKPKSKPVKSKAKPKQPKGKSKAKQEPPQDDFIEDDIPF